MCFSFFFFLFRLIFNISHYLFLNYTNLSFTGFSCRVICKTLVCANSAPQITPSANESEYEKVKIPLALMRYRDFLAAKQVSRVSFVSLRFVGTDVFTSKLRTFLGFGNIKLMLLDIEIVPV